MVHLTCGPFNSCGSFYIHFDYVNNEKMSGWYLKQEGISLFSYGSARGNNLAKV